MSVATSKGAQRIKGEHSADAEQIRLRDLESVMSTPAGRRFMFHLIDSRCRLFSASYTGNSETFLNEGKRSVGIAITQELQDRYPQLYTQMLSEAFNLKQRDRLIEQAAENKAREEDER